MDSKITSKEATKRFAELSLERQILFLAYLVHEISLEGQDVQVGSAARDPGRATALATMQRNVAARLIDFLCKADKSAPDRAFFDEIVNDHEVAASERVARAFERAEKQ